MLMSPAEYIVNDTTSENVASTLSVQISVESVSALSSSSCTDFTKPEDISLRLPSEDLSDPSSLVDDFHEDDDEALDNENFENDDDDEGDTLQEEGGRSSRGKWTVEEDETLRTAVQRHSGKNWKKISDCLEGRTDVQCLHRWQKVLRPGLIKGPWTKEVSYRSYHVSDSVSLEKFLLLLKFDEHSKNFTSNFRFLCLGG